MTARRPGQPPAHGLLARGATLLRRHPLVRRTAAGVVDKLVASLPPSTPLGLRAGRAMDSLAEDLPAVLVLCLGIDSADLPSAVREVATAQLVVGGFRPIFVVDAAGFTAARRAGYPVEHLVPAAEWAARDDTTSWPAYAAARLERLRADYGNAPLVSLPRADDPAAVRDLLAALLLDARAHAGPRRHWRTVARLGERVQQVIDRPT